MSLWGGGDLTCYVYPVTFIMQNFLQLLQRHPFVQNSEAIMNGVCHPISQVCLTATLEMVT